MSKDNLHRNAQALRDAADCQDWEKVSLLLSKLDLEARNSTFQADDRALVVSTLKLLSEAMQSASKRREEIRNLVNKLGDAPI